MTGVNIIYNINKTYGGNKGFASVVFKLRCRLRCLTKIADFMTINKISIGRIAIMLSFYFNFSINVLANIC